MVFDFVICVIMWEVIWGGVIFMKDYNVMALYDVFMLDIG